MAHLTTMFVAALVYIFVCAFSHEIEDTWKIFQEAVTLRYEVLISPSRAITFYCQRQYETHHEQVRPSPSFLSFRQMLSCHTKIHWRKDLSIWKDVCDGEDFEEHPYKHKIERYFLIVTECEIQIIDESIKYKLLQFLLYR